MMRSFQFVSRVAVVLTAVCCLTACASSQKHHASAVTPDKETVASLPPILTAGSQSQKYNLQLDFMKHHFSGLLIVRRLPDDEIRILASTYFGLSLFDFSLKGDVFSVNSCVEPMRKENILRLLETDFKNLFLSNMTLRKRKRNQSAEQSKAVEKRVTGRGFGKSVYTLSKFVEGQAEQVQIKHPWIRLKIQVDKLNE